MAYVLDHSCERCGEALDPQRATWLELDSDTNLFHDPAKGIPEGHSSQGAFPFGSACARQVLKSGGVCRRIRGRK